MPKQACLIFSLDEYRYGINATYVEEVFSLPEVQLLPSTSPDLIGGINLRGDIVPILDPKLSLGYDNSSYKTTDQVIVLRQSQLRVGLIVNSVEGLENMSSTIIESNPQLQEKLSQARRKNMIVGEMPVANSISTEQFIWLLDEPEKWLRYIEIQSIVSLTTLVQEDNKKSEFQAKPSSDKPVFCPTATPNEYLIFKQRAYNLKQLIDGKNSLDLKTLAIVEIKGMYFGADLSLVKEFTEISNITPIPCCPRHIIGNMNLRGDILTIVDIWNVLNRSLEKAEIENLDPSAKVMVTEVDNDMVGVLVSNVPEAMFSLRPQDVLPLAIEQLPVNANYLEGLAIYKEQIIGILDLSKILLQGSLLVDEIV